MYVFRSSLGVQDGVALLQVSNKPQKVELYWTRTSWTLDFFILDTGELSEKPHIAILY